MNTVILSKIKNKFKSNKKIQIAIESGNNSILFIELIKEKEKAQTISTKTVSNLLKRLANGSNMELKIDIGKLKKLVDEKLEIIDLVEEFEIIYDKEEKEDYWF